MSKRLIGLLSLVGCLMLAGCGKEPQAQSDATKPPPVPKMVEPAKTAAPAMEAISTADLDQVPKSPKELKLALVVKTRNNPFFTPMIEAAEAEAKKLGVKLDVQAPPQESDKERQFALCQDVVAKGVDALLIAPADSKAIVPALKAAAEKGVLVVNVDNRVDAAAAQAAGLNLGGYVGADNEAGGKLAGEALVAKLGGKGKIAILEGIRGADNAESRKRGCEAAVKGKLEVVATESAEWDTKLAYDKMQSILAKHADLAGVFCANDKMALGAVKAIAEAGRKGQIAVVGYDNIADVKPLLSSNQMAATIEQHPDLMGKYAVRMAVGMLSGGLPKGRENLVKLDVVK
ncbi:MAG: substrate-binding domain-containing protein [Armatimonadetes bacterium]|nr:substrate-binding domain-containing protein [Armatimonadota bacterium]